MWFFNKEVELIIPPEKQNANNKAIKVKSLNGHDATRGKLDEGNTMTVKTPVEPTTKPKTKVSIGLLFNWNVFISVLHILKIWLSFRQPIS